jgi:glutamate--cysteine ligase
MASLTFKDSLKGYQDSDFFKTLEINRGIERESLRINQQGQISQSEHPKGLGSPLTNPDITTDFAEALVELVTPTFSSAEGLFNHLSDLHHFLYSTMGDEILWNFSMPCAFNSPEEIRIAEYGSSNSGMLKHVYRKGLSLRYGSIMQCVSGIHFNFSVSKNSWLAIESNPTQEFISEKYLGLIRNVKRNSWFLLDQFGASPIAHESYLLNREHHLKKYGLNDLFLPAATSLRMSEVGYQSSIQETLGINYNNLKEFINSIIQGINTTHQPFEELGLLDDAGVPQQISGGILQIENELYDIVRPKRAGASTSRPSNLLRREGIEYVELRGVDVNPYIPEGISIDNIKMLDLFLMHSLISDSPYISDEEGNQIRLNHVQMVEHGRSDSTQLKHAGSSSSLEDLRKDFHAELMLLAAAMDEYSNGYSESLAKGLGRDKTLSQKIMDEMKINNMSFQEYGLDQSKKIASSFSKDEKKDMSRFIEASQQSLKELKLLEESTSMNINKYVELYNSKLKEEK